MSSLLQDGVSGGYGASVSVFEDELAVGDPTEQGAKKLSKRKTLCFLVFFKAEV